MKNDTHLEELARLKKENAYLKKLLSNMMHQREANESTESISEVRILTNRSLPQEKITLFQSLFKGRTDAYAVRWESKNGKSGYMPACKHEWQKPLCEKPNIKCSECSNRKLLPLTNQVLFDHLSGKKTIGLYPMLPDETCAFLAFDFDKHSWKEDVLAFVKVCKELNVPIHIERSRSGNGAHCWLFFSEDVAASLARKLGSALLEKTMENRHEIGIDSFDRMFPNQDTLPRGGFGNLIALPLQLHSKKAGNSVFVDETFTPYQDQWMYLSTVEKFSANNILSVLNKLKSHEKAEPVFTATYPAQIDILVKNGLYIKKEHIPSSLFSKILAIAAFKNPEFYKAQAKRMSTYGLQRIISCSDEDVEHIILPRGCKKELEKLFHDYSIEANYIPKYYEGEEINVTFNGKLTPQQEEAVSELLNHTNGVLSATTGFGKTVAAAAMIAKRKTNTLIIVDRTQLLDQWIEKLAAFLALPPEEIGQYSGGKKKITAKVDIATIQSIKSKGELKSFITQYGQVIVDECHHIPAFSFEKVLKAIRAKYVYGLTATPIRKDGLHPIIFMQCGPIRYKVDGKTQAKIRPFKHRLIQKVTSFTSSSAEIQEIYKTMSSDKGRNQQLFNDVLNELEAGRSPIILTERIEHLERMKKQFKGFAKNIIILSGNMSKKERNIELKRLEKISDDEERLVIATGKFIGEGFDDPRLDTLFLAMPIAWKGTLQQYVGRLHRIHSNKQEVRVYDYVDKQVPILKKMFEKRLEGYKAMGYEIKKKENLSEQMKLF